MLPTPRPNQAGEEKIYCEKENFEPHLQRNSEGKKKKETSWFLFLSVFLYFFFTLPIYPLQFKVVMDVLKTQTLSVSVWHNDTFGRNAFLGKVDLDLSEWDFSNTQINEYALKARVKMSNF